MQNVRFQYSLRLLLLGTFGASVVVISAVSLRSSVTLESILGSPLVFVYCIVGVLVLTALGGVVAGRVGAAVGAVSAVATWLLLLDRLLIDLFDTTKYAAHFAVHSVVAGVTLAIVMVAVFRRERPLRSDDDQDTLKRLLDDQQSRRNRG